MSNGEGRSTNGFGIGRDESVNLIVKTAVQSGIEDPKQVAYMLATAQHETRDFNAPEEDYGRSQARKLGYSGGEEFYGRGYVHLTHDYNYRKFDELLDLNGELVKNPDLAKDPETAAKILVVGMRDGLFTGKRLDRYINEDGQDFYNARRIVNGITRDDWTIRAAQDCERYAGEWEKQAPSLIESAKQRIAQDAFDPVRNMREGIGRVIDGSATFGPRMTDGGLPEYLLSPHARAKLPLADGVLREGERGVEVGALQMALNAHSAKEGRTPSLAVDNVYGPATRREVEAFQLWNGMPTTGVADSETLSAVRRAQVPSPDNPADAADLRDPNQGYGSPFVAPTPSAPSRKSVTEEDLGRLGWAASADTPPAASSDVVPPMTRSIESHESRDSRNPTDPAHPDHADYMKVHDAVTKDGRWTDEQATNISAALLKEYKADPLSRRLDSVKVGNMLPNGDVNIFASYEPWGPGKGGFHAWVGAAEAAQQPAERSFEQAQQVTQQQALAQQETARALDDPNRGAPKMAM
jgi:predicted chitinase